MSDDSGHHVSSDTATPADIQPTLSLDTVLELLADQRRRFALYTLVDAPDGVVTLDKLVEDVATLEAALTDAALRRERYIETATDLYHWQLDVLADVGVVNYDERSETIRYHGEPLLEAWLTRVRGSELTHQR